MFLDANKRPIHSEDLIKFAHRISASHAVSAPLTWQVGDLRRPYPTDIEMRLGFLGKSDLAVNGNTVSTPNSVGDSNRTGGYYINKKETKSTSLNENFPILEIPASAQNQFAWHPSSGEIHMSMGTTGGSVSIVETRAHKDASQDDASTDSSSSSSSDSQ